MIQRKGYIIIGGCSCLALLFATIFLLPILASLVMFVVFALNMMLIAAT